MIILSQNRLNVNNTIEHHPIEYINMFRETTTIIADTLFGIHEKVKTLMNLNQEQSMKNFENQEQGKEMLY